MAASRDVRPWVVAAAVLICGCGGNDRGPTNPTPATTSVPGPPTPATTTIPVVFGPEIFVGAGDVAMSQFLSSAQQTADLLERIGGTVFAVGDLAYMDGTARDFHDNYDPTWGRVGIKSRTRPVPGNHEYNSPGAQPYFDYFGTNAGPPGRGYYSYPLGGAWHAFALNSGPEPANGDFVNSAAQLSWLRDDLLNNHTPCTLAYFHYPLFTSGPNMNQTVMRPIWRMLYDAGVDLIINGHDHLYERFAPQDPDGNFDPQRGIREFIVGTGGASPYQFRPDTQPNSEVRIHDTPGVMKFTLSSSSYQWEFISVAGGTPDQGGPVQCHGPRTPTTSALKGFLLRRP